MVARLRVARIAGLERRTTGVVVAQVWRDPGGGQADLARLLGAVAGRPGGALTREVRQELVARQLRRHLPPADRGRTVRAVDIGCGQGTQAIRLAAAGYQVTGVDPSAELLAAAGRVAAAETDATTWRLTWEQAALVDPSS